MYILQLLPVARINGELVIMLIRYLIFGLLLLVPLCGCGGGGNEEARVGSRLRFVLTDRSQMATVVYRKPPKLRRTMAGELEVLVKERDADHIELEVQSISFRSVEDDSYVVTTVTGGTIAVRRLEDIDVDLAVSVNGAEEATFIGSMAFEDMPALLDREPPALRGFTIRNDIISPEVRGPTGYGITIFATLDGQTVPTPLPAS